ncbi:hypothetical protein SAMN05216319_5095 [Duganella sp. CF402]|nr:hypothetical protein EV582_3924 [Duganella sp. BK701]SEM97603.1 hypothetical protein SAMN05216319_5095 [Duganella sp. CF402]
MLPSARPENPISCHFGNFLLRHCNSLAPSSHRGPTLSINAPTGNRTAGKLLWRLLLNRLFPWAQG